MGANPQSLQHLSCAVLQLAEIISFGGQWEVSLVHREFVRMESSWKMSAKRLECFQPVLGACYGGV